MGWSSNGWGCGVSEKRIKEAALHLQTDYQKAGYNYIIIDNGWQATTRNAAGDLQANKKRFPDGMKVLIEYLKKMNFKVGISSSSGEYTTCSNGN